MFCQQYERASGCTGCVIGGCAKQNSCDTEGCIKQCCGKKLEKEYQREG
jgi:hypothetical protein